MNIFKSLGIVIISILIVSCSKDEVEEKDYIPTEDQYGIVAYTRSQTEGVLAYISKDGKTWEKHKTNLKETSHRFKTIVFAKSKLWGLKDPGCAKHVPLLMTSYDGINWTEVSTNISQDKVARRINDLYYDYDKKIFVLSAEGKNCFEGAFLTSKNGRKWSTTIHSEVGSRCNLIKMDNGTYISVGNKGMSTIKENILTSTDLVNWEAFECPHTSFWHVAIKVDDKLYAGRSSAIHGDKEAFKPQFCSTTDGKTWDAAKGTFDYNMAGDMFPGVKSLTYGNNIYVGLSEENKGIVRSEDGVNWEKAGKFAGPWLENYVAYANGLFIAGAFCVDVTKNKYLHNVEMDIIYYSANGKDWIPAVNTKGCGVDFIRKIPIYQK